MARLADRHPVGAFFALALAAVFAATVVAALTIWATTQLTWPLVVGAADRSSTLGLVALTIFLVGLAVAATAAAALGGSLVLGRRFFKPVEPSCDRCHAHGSSDLHWED